MTDKITIAYAPDDKYLNQTLVSMESAVLNNDDIQFVILYSNLSDENILKLINFEKKNSCVVRLVKVDKEEFENFPMSDWVTVEAWFRVKLPDLCADLDRVLYLDCDTLVCGNLNELWQINLDNKFLAAVQDVWDVKKHIRRLDLKQATYFNSGMILFNCKFCRENNFFDLIKSCAFSDNLKIKFCDQDVLNAVSDGKKVIVSPKYNYMNTWWRNFYYEYEGEMEKEYIEAEQKPVIIHFTGIKSCFKGCGHPLQNLWWEYASKTDVFDELQQGYNTSKPTKNSFTKQIFSIKNEFSHKKKIKTLTLLGLKFPLSGNLYNK